MASQDKDKIIKPGEPGFHIDAPRPNPGSNTADRLAGSLPRAPAPTGRPGDTTASWETPGPEAPRSTLGGHYQGRTPDRGRQVKERARDVGRQAKARTAQARERVGDLWQQADRWIEHQVAMRPIGMVGGAFAAGYVISAGLPRWFTRNLARVALPLAAAAYLVRLATEDTERDVYRSRPDREGTSPHWR